MSPASTVPSDGAGSSADDGFAALAALASPITSQAPAAASNRWFSATFKLNQERKIGSAQASNNPMASATGAPSSSPRVMASPCTFPDASVGLSMPAASTRWQTTSQIRLASDVNVPAN